MTEGKEEKKDRPDAGEPKQAAREETPNRPNPPDGDGNDRETALASQAPAAAADPASSVDRPAVPAAEGSGEGTGGSNEGAKGSGEGAGGAGATPTARKGLSEEEKAARLARAAAARAARAQAQGGEGQASAGAAPSAGDGAAPAEPKPPSPNQPKLDALAELIREAVHPDAIEEAFVNEKDNDLMCLVIRSGHWPETARLLREREQIDYLRNLAGVDYETHMEVVYHLFSFESRENLCVKVRTDRDHPSVPSVTSVWPTADWNEREAYDLLGIDFPGHPDLRRILMPDDWVGHPLRKDYKPYDPEV